MNWQHCEQKIIILIQLRVNMMKVEDRKDEVKHCFIHGQLYEGLCLCMWSIILFQVMIRQARSSLI